MDARQIRVGLDGRACGAACSVAAEAVANCLDLRNKVAEMETEIAAHKRAIEALNQKACKEA